MGGIFIASPGNEPEDRTQRIPDRVFCAALAGCVGRGGRCLGGEDGAAPTAAMDRRWTDPGPVWCGLSGMHGVVTSRAGGWIVKAGVTAKGLAGEGTQKMRITADSQR